MNGPLTVTTASEPISRSDIQPPTPAQASYNARLSTLRKIVDAYNRGNVQEALGLLDLHHLLTETAAAR